MNKLSLKELALHSELLPKNWNKIQQLPEKIMQFGSGVLLRGLCDFVINKANIEGEFDGRIVVIKSTDGGDSQAFDDQNGLYTICERGIENGQKIEKNTVCSAISRLISAKTDWQAVLEFAKSPDLSIIISNTTEVGIELVQESIDQNPPSSFPAKLLAVLYERFRFFEGNKQTGETPPGLIIIPTELIMNNGDKLQNIVLELAHLNNLEADFIDWLENSNTFCNSLVDRIVPGKPSVEVAQQIESALGYQDNLLIMSEPFLLWAIEGNEEVKNKLSFCKTHQGVVVEPNIEKYRELKLRLLNGTHTLACGLAYLQGFKYVKDAMKDSQMEGFIQNLLFENIAKAIPYEMPKEMIQNFGEQVLDRFRNPYIDHQWLSITLNYSSKMLMRNIPVLLTYYDKFQTVPTYFAKGFAAYLLFMKAVKEENGKYYGNLNGEYYLIQDEKAGYFMQKWQQPEILVGSVLSDKNLWRSDLTLLEGFENAVKNNMKIRVPI